MASASAAHRATKSMTVTVTVTLTVTVTGSVSVRGQPIIAGILAITMIGRSCVMIDLPTIVVPHARHFVIVAAIATSGVSGVSEHVSVRVIRTMTVVIKTIVCPRLGPLLAPPAGRRTRVCLTLIPLLPLHRAHGGEGTTSVRGAIGEIDVRPKALTSTVIMVGSSRRR